MPRRRWIRSVGRVDILIANLARPFAFRPAVEQDDGEMQRLTEAIFYPLHRLVRAVVPQMLERKRGKIVVVGSTAGIKGRTGGVALYGAARGAHRLSTWQQRVVTGEGVPRSQLLAYVAQ